MTITAPTLERVTVGRTGFVPNRSVERLFVCSRWTIAFVTAFAFSCRPEWSAETYGRPPLNASVESTTARSKRCASFFVNARTLAPWTFTTRSTRVPGSEARPRATAVLMYGVASVAGSRSSRLRSTTTARCRANFACTDAIAAAGVRPPTGTPPTRTRSGIRFARGRGGGVVVVVVVVFVVVVVTVVEVAVVVVAVEVLAVDVVPVGRVSATTVAEKAPAHAKPSTNSGATMTLLTPESV